MIERYKKGIVQHIVRSLLDLQLLRIIQTQPTWGYRIKKQFEAEFNVKLRHGALYPALNSLQRKGFLECATQQQGRRIRKVYVITEDGKLYLQAYYSILQTQLASQNSVPSRACV